MTKTTAPRLLIDFQIFANARQGLLLPDTSRPEREGFTEAIAKRLRADRIECDAATGVPQILSWVTRNWEPLRHEVVHVREDGRRVTAEEIVLRPANGGSAGYAIGGIVEMLLHARARREQLVAQLAALDAIEHVFATPDERQVVVAR